MHCARPLSHGTRLEGTWFDRIAQYEARRGGEDRSAANLGTPEYVVFSPLPCWAQLDTTAYRQRIVELLRSAVDEGRRQHSGRPVLGRRAILEQHPHDEPLTHDRSPARAVHAATKAIRIMLRTAYRQIVDAYREASLKLRHGDRLVCFPAGAFPPPMPCLLLSG